MSATLAPADIERLRYFIREELDAGGFELPVLPDIAVKVQEAARKPFSNARVLAKLIEPDGSMTAHILKMANSARYAGIEKVASLDGAIARLGTEMAVSTVLAVSSKSVFRCDDPRLRAYLKEVWHRSAYSAAAARHLCHRTTLNAEQAFLAGLMMDLGEPVLITAAERLVRIGRLERPEAAALVAAIAPIAPEACARLLDSWRLPQFLVDAVRYQGDPAGAPGGPSRSAALVAFAGAIARLLTARMLPSQVVAQLAEHPLVPLLVIDRARLSGWVMEIGSEARELVKLF